MNQSPVQMDRIKSFKGENAFLSNYHPCALLVQGINYPTLEHAYQAAKVLDRLDKVKISIAETPSRAKRLIRDMQTKPNWNSQSLHTMENLVRIKFLSPSLAYSLMCTGNRSLENHNEYKDSFWGIYEGSGENHLGRILMRVREEISNTYGHSIRLMFSDGV